MSRLRDRSACAVKHAVEMSRGPLKGSTVSRVMRLSPAWLRALSYLDATGLAHLESTCHGMRHKHLSADGRASQVDFAAERTAVRMYAALRGWTHDLPRARRALLPPTSGRWVERVLALERRSLILVERVVTANDSMKRVDYDPWCGVECAPSHPVYAFDLVTRRYNTLTDLRHASVPRPECPENADPATWAGALPHIPLSRNVGLCTVNDGALYCVDERTRGVLRWEPTTSEWAHVGTTPCRYANTVHRGRPVYYGLSPYFQVTAYGKHSLLVSYVPNHWGVNDTSGLQGHGHGQDGPPGAAAAAAPPPPGLFQNLAGPLPQPGPAAAQLRVPPRCAGVFRNPPDPSDNAIQHLPRLVFDVLDTVTGEWTTLRSLPLLYRHLRSPPAAPAAGAGAPAHVVVQNIPHAAGAAPPAVNNVVELNHLLNEAAAGALDEALLPGEALQQAVAAAAAGAGPGGMGANNVGLGAAGAGPMGRLIEIYSAGHARTPHQVVCTADGALVVSMMASDPTSTLERARPRVMAYDADLDAWDELGAPKPGREVGLGIWGTCKFGPSFAVIPTPPGMETDGGGAAPAPDGATAPPRGGLLVLGGSQEVPAGQFRARLKVPVAAVRQLGAARDVWSVAPPLATPRAGAAAVPLHGDLAGGYAVVGGVCDGRDANFLDFGGVALPGVKASPFGSNREARATASYDSYCTSAQLPTVPGTCLSAAMMSLPY